MERNSIINWKLAIGDIMSGEDEYTSSWAYWWVQDKRVHVDVVLKHRDASGDMRAGDCACHKKCYESQTHTKLFPRRYSNKRNHFWRGPGKGRQGNPSDCTYRRRSTLVGERNEFYEEFLANLYAYLSGTGGMEVPGHEGPRKIYGISRLELGGRSRKSPDITIHHGPFYDRKYTHIYVINQNKNRANDVYSEDRTPFNTVIIEISQWSRELVDDFLQYGVRKMNEQWGFLKSRIEAEAERKKAREKLEINRIRTIFNSLIDAEKLDKAKEWKTWLESASNQQLKEVYERDKTTLEKLVEELKEEEKREAERLAEIEAERLAEIEADLREKKRLAEIEADRLWRENQAKKQKEEERKRLEKKRRTDAIVDCQRHAAEIKKISKPLKDRVGSYYGQKNYQLQPIVDFCACLKELRKPPHFSRILFKNPIKDLFDQYWKEPFEISPEELLTGIIETLYDPDITIVWKDEYNSWRYLLRETISENDLKSFYQISELLSSEIEKIEQTLEQERLDSLLKDYHQLVGTSPPSYVAGDSQSLEIEISSIRTLRKVDADIQRLSELCKDLQEAINKINTSSQDYIKQLETWSTLIDYCHKIINEWNGLDESEKRTSAISDFFESNNYTIKKLIDNVSELPTIGIVNGVKALPYRMIGMTPLDRKNWRRPRGIRFSNELFDAIIKGIDNLEKVPGYLERLQKIQSEEEKRRAIQKKIDEDILRKNRIESKVEDALNRGNRRPKFKLNTRRGPRKR